MNFKNYYFYDNKILCFLNILPDHDFVMVIRALCCGLISKFMSFPCGKMVDGLPLAFILCARSWSINELYYFDDHSGFWTQRILDCANLQQLVFIGASM